MLHALYKMWNASISAVANVPGIVWSLSLAQIIPAITQQSDAAGGNVLGLKAPPRGLILAILSASWNNTADDSVVGDAADDLLEDLIAAAKRTSSFHAYIDLNHAAEEQDPFESYGRKNKNFLKVVSRKYDPRGTFRTQSPGGFKLF
jgi:hypothetical protein